jgi:3-oxoacyl-[acyl-carrier-protein] synthase-3
VAGQSETALDMAIKCAEKLFQRFDKSRIDMVLLCTQSPDYFLPTSACILQDRLGLKTTAGALDFNLGCSGYVYGLALAKGLIEGGISQCVLLITSETYTKHIHPKDIGNRTIFGDGAATTIIEKSDVEGIGQFALGTDGSGHQNLIVPNGAFKSRYNPGAPEVTDESGATRTANHLAMNGPEIFNFTIEAVPGLVQKAMEKNGLSLDQVDYVVFHQANKYMLEYLMKKIGISPDKFYINMLDTGNTVSATIPIALRQCLDKGKIKRGNRVLLVGFGVGYSYGATVVCL